MGTLDRQYDRSTATQLRRPAWGASAFVALLVGCAAAIKTPPDDREVGDRDEISASHEHVSATARERTHKYNDVRLCMQGTYSQYDLCSHGVTNTAFAINGSALVAGKTLNLQQFLAAGQKRIRRSFEQYLKRHPKLRRETTDLVLLDMEHPVHPRHFFKYDGEPVLQRRIFAAFKLRIGVARELLPNAMLSFPAVATPYANVSVNDRNFWLQVKAQRRAGKMGMFDDVDYISPFVYNRYGPQDGQRYDDGRFEKFTKVAIQGAMSIRKSDGRPIPIAPFLSFTIFNARSLNNGQRVLPLRMRFQLNILHSYPAVKTIVFWVASDRDFHPRYFESMTRH